MDPQLQDIVERVRAIGGIAEEAASDVARAIERDLRRTIREGTTPEGEKWKPRQDDGEQPLQNAEAALHVGAYAGTVYVRLTGVEARHHRGRARGGVKRQIIMEGATVPPRMAASIRVVLQQHFDKAVAGG